MRKIIFALISLTLLIIACNNQPQQPVNHQLLSFTKENDSVKVHRILVPNDSGLVYLDFENGHIKERIRKDSMQTVIVEFNPGDSTRFHGWLSSRDSLANIRFSQIFMPDSTADGPFGQELKYKLTQRGTYRLRIGENMMAGDPWAGVFMLRIELSN